MALEQRPNGSVFIFHHGYQYRREPDGSWTKRTFNRWKQVSARRARRARRLEHANQHRDEVKQVQRFPRHEPELRIAELIQQVFTSIAQRRVMNKKIGRACIELKDLVGHGHWQSFFKKTFGSRLNLRTAERYMELARKQDSASKIDTVSNLKLSTSKRARKMRQATDRAKADVDKARRSDPASIIEGKIKSLRQSSHWRDAAPRIIAYLEKLCRQYGVVVAAKNTERSAVA
jgi:hypothetical protein